MYTGLCCLNWIVLVMNWAGWTGQIVDFINFDIKRETDIVPAYLEVGIIHQIHNIALGTGKEVIDAKNIIPIVQ